MQLHVPYDVAGVTFLAFGNGAPDVFSAIAAYSSGVGEAGINELLGGAMFVSTVVVGCVAIASEVNVQRWSFSRDVGTLVITLLLLLALEAGRHDTGDGAFLLLMMYALYVASVVLPACLSRVAAARHAVQDDAGDPKSEVSLVVSAFWHVLSPRKATDGEQPYSFVTKQDAEVPPPTSESTAPANASYELSSPRKATLPRFSSKLFDDHFQTEDEESLSSPLISDEDRTEEEGEVASPRWLGFSSGGGMLAAAYWRHLRWRWGLQRSIARIWYGDSSILVKVLSIPQATLVIVRDISIPLLEPDSWRRSLASVSPITVPILVLLVTETLTTRIKLSFISREVVAWQAVLVIGLVISVAVSFTTHRSHPPKSLMYTAFFLLLAFVSCVCWIYAVANELVALLVAAGIISHAGNSLLSLTVLAWGNSVGDLITNVSVARAGFAQMAIAGCFGGPVFNILLGLGIPMAVAFFQGDDMSFGFDAHAWISMAFLFVTLTSTAIVVRHYGFHCPVWYGKVLVAYYAVYSIVNLAVAFRAPKP